MCLPSHLVWHYFDPWSLHFSYTGLQSVSQVFQALFCFPAFVQGVLFGRVSFICTTHSQIPIHHSNLSLNLHFLSEDLPSLGWIICSLGSLHFSSEALHSIPSLFYEQLFGIWLPYWTVSFMRVSTMSALSTAVFPAPQLSIWHTASIQ